MGWSDIIDISKFEVSAAPYGGPIGENHGLFELLNEKRNIKNFYKEL